MSSRPVTAVADPSPAVEPSAPSASRAHRATLLAREEIAHATLALRLERPAGFAFRAGQAVDLQVAIPGGGHEAHAFSIASAPYEDHLLLATRLRATPYKEALAALAPGAAVGVDGPFGSLLLHRSAARDAVMVAGGIGITPFRSMLRQAAHERDARRFVLLYANRRPEDAAFLEELLRLEAVHDRVRVLATMTRAGAPAGAWAGRRGALDAALVQEAACGLRSPVFYLAGPPGMVGGAREALAQAGIDDDDIRGEEFHGY